MLSAIPQSYLANRQYSGCIPPGGDKRFEKKSQGNREEISSSNCIFYHFLHFLAVFKAFLAISSTKMQKFAVKTGKVSDPQICGGGEEIRIFGQNIDRCIWHLRRLHPSLLLVYYLGY